MLVRHTAVALFLLAFASLNPAWSATAGKAGGGELTIADQGQTTATVVVSPTAGAREKQAAADLVKYIGYMSGASPKLADKAESIQAAMVGSGPVLVVGQEAVKAKPALAQK